MGECLLRPVVDRSPLWKRIFCPPRIFEVASAFTFTCKYGSVVVNRGFVSDGASVPRPFRWIFPAAGNYLRAAIVHDFALRVYERRTADRIFREALAFDGVMPTTAAILYTAVRAYSAFEAFISSIRSTMQEL